MCAEYRVPIDRVYLNLKTLLIVLMAGLDAAIKKLQKQM